MKIQTQTRLLAAGIMSIPVLIILAVSIYRLFLSDEIVYEVPAYNDVSPMLDEHLNSHDWDSITRSVARFRSFGNITIFRDDFLVLYSEIPEFSQGVFVSWENIWPLLQDKRFIFSSIGSEDTQGYILINLKSHSVKDRLVRFFFPALIGISLICLLTIFAICMPIVLTRTITNSVKVLENATRRIAEGELDLKVEVKGSNEITSLVNSLNKMRNALKEGELSRSRFIMGISHDLKTPLALIKGYAEAISDGVAEDATSRTKAVEIIAAKADQLEDMINDLIDYVHMETGEWRSQLNSVSISCFLRSMVKDFCNDVDVLQHNFIHEIDLPDTITVSMDDRLVIRAFDNLIHNAVRYSPKGSLIRLAAVQREKAIEIKISDNGPGLDSDELPHIFELFYRGSSSRREQGMGLGLAVVKWVVDYHGWSIAVSAAKGEGTCFTITIPLM